MRAVPTVAAPPARLLSGSPMTPARFCAVLAAGTALTTLPASAAALVVRLNLKGGYANQALVACGNSHHYTFFRVGLLKMDGSVQPAPRTSGWRIKGKVKRCVAGRFRAGR